MDIAHLNDIARSGLETDASQDQLLAAQRSLKKALVYYAVPAAQRAEARRLIQAIQLRVTYRRLGGAKS